MPIVGLRAKPGAAAAEHLVFAGEAKSLAHEVPGLARKARRSDREAKRLAQEVPRLARKARSFADKAKSLAAGALRLAPEAVGSGEGARRRALLAQLSQLEGVPWS